MGDCQRTLLYTFITHDFNGENQLRFHDFLEGGDQADQLQRLDLDKGTFILLDAEGRLRRYMANGRRQMDQGLKSTWEKMDKMRIRSGFFVPHSNVCG